MDAPTPRLAARPDPNAVEKRPQIVAGAVAAKLRQVFPADAPDAVGSEFDRECREKLDAFERARRAQALSELAEMDGKLL